MTRRGTIVVWLSGLILAGALVGVTMVGFSRGPLKCSVCQRAVNQRLAFKATLENGRKIETCCSRCGLRYVMTSGQPARSMRATDFATGKLLPAKEAIYVSGSRFTHCAPTGLQQDSLGCCYLKVYDRCLPSLVAFKNRAEAQRFQAKYGGEIMSYQKVLATDEVIKGARNPAG